MKANVSTHVISLQEKQLHLMHLKSIVERAFEKRIPMFKIHSNLDKDFIGLILIKASEIEENEIPSLIKMYMDQTI